MTLIIQIPESIEAALAKGVEGDLSVYALEAVAVDLYRNRKLSHGQFQKLLGVSSYQADEVLKRHGGVDELTEEELLAQVEASWNLRHGKSR